MFAQNKMHAGLGGESLESLLLNTQNIYRQADLERRAGLLIPVFGLRHDGDIGIGNTKALKNAIAFCAEYGFSLIQILPICETDGNNSPYLSLSTFALEPALLSATPEDFPGLTKNDFDLIVKSKTFASCDKHDFINYASVKNLAYELHFQAFTRFLSEHLDTHSTLAGEFQDFCAKEWDVWLENYSIYRTCIDLNDGKSSWVDWPEKLHAPENAKNFVAASKNGSLLQEFYCYRQWVAYRQWNDVKQFAQEHNCRLIGDIPFGVNLNGVDVWANKNLFDISRSLGAPAEYGFQADEFTKNWGQNWGARPYIWEEHIKNDYTWWKQRINQTLKCCHDIRLDHALGAFRAYVFPWEPKEDREYSHLSPEQAKQKAGGRLPEFYPRPDHGRENIEFNKRLGTLFFSNLMQACEPHKARILAEDAGACVPQYVRGALNDLNIPGMSFVGMERHYGKKEYIKAHEIPELKVAYFGTHDHPALRSRIEEIINNQDSRTGRNEVRRLLRLAGWGDNMELREYTPDLQRSLIMELMRSPANYALMNVLDLLNDTSSWNNPGSAGSECWSLRLSKPLEYYAEDTEIRKTLDLLKTCILEHRA